MQMRRAGAVTGNRYRRSTVSLAVAAVIAPMVIVLATAEPAQADASRPHVPIGAVTSTTAIAGGLRFTGWAAAPDALTTNDTVAVIVDGRTRTASLTTSVANSTVATRYGTGPTPGFT